jgi:hypothetical protein
VAVKTAKGGGEKAAPQRGRVPGESEKLEMSEIGKRCSLAAAVRAILVVSRRRRWDRKVL